jgi:membrane-bound lysozyme inhibitor of c-type lysozyme MliC
MNAVRVVCAVLALGAAAGSPALSQPAPMKVPMNDFNQAFYRCDAGGEFMMSYDADDPAKAELAGNDGAKPHELKRVPASGAVEFTGGGVKFWTDGKSVTVDGAKAPFKNCKMKAG